ncbi:hypothetical protein [Vibrio sp. 99-70-13A1]|uniref:hypothetical protein n=1 Tax=Vibrio sp. 99-70-13A1 TaxID=2607601 RepID=UPI001493854D|nr:hypothetical protein [Vibrio sp. 99-70-13A1]NOH98820.1 hypothetical protein [Vibrio sp. 99-70-13A1]
MNNPLLHPLSLLPTQPLFTQPLFTQPLFTQSLFTPSRRFLLAILCPAPLMSFAWLLFTL